MNDQQDIELTACKFTEFEDEVKKIVNEEVQAQLADREFSGAKMAEWTAHIADKTIQRLQKLQKPFKYIVACNILQNVGAGYNTSSACLWDANTDGSCSVRVEFPTMYCIVAVYGTCLVPMPDNSNNE